MVEYNVFFLSAIPSLYFCILTVGQELLVFFWAFSSKNCEMSRSSFWVIIVSEGSFCYFVCFLNFQIFFNFFHCYNSLFSHKLEYFILVVYRSSIENIGVTIIFEILQSMPREFIIEFTIHYNRTPPIMPGRHFSAEVVSIKSPK